MNPSIRIENSVEFINITPINPLISHCQIKVCYVQDEPNRKGSVITKETAKYIANSLPGSPIVGYYNEEKEDFEGHNRVIEVSKGQFKLKDTTRPYGFVDLNARVWFEKYLENGVEREYLLTEGYLWTGQYPEARRIIDKGNNQSMELGDKIINAYWTKDNKGKPQFFIINEAIISKLCVLGEDVEPCFEGASVTKFEFSLEDSFKQQLFSMMEEIKNILSKGGTSVMNLYAVEIGNSLWNHLYEYMDSKCGKTETGAPEYRIDGVYEQDGQTFAVLQHRSSGEYYQLNFELGEEDNFSASDDMVQITETYTPAEEVQFAAEAVEEYEAGRYTTETEPTQVESNPEENTVSDQAEEPVAQYNLEEIPEYVELLNNYSALQTNYDALLATNARLDNQVAELTTFKKGIEKKEKQAMINSFYMLSDEDKKDVIENIDTYSVDEIEAKLSVICVRNKVSFSLDNEEENNTGDDITVYNLDSHAIEDSAIPAWLKAVQAVAEKM